MQSHISKSSYTRKQQKEFLRTWNAIGRAHVSASHSPDLFQLLDIASSSLVADHDCGDYGSLYSANLSPAASQLQLNRPTALVEEHRGILVGPGQTLPVEAAAPPLCTPNSTSVTFTSRPGATSISLPGKRQMGFGQASEPMQSLFGDFASTTSASPTRNTSFGFKPIYNTSSTSSAVCASKSS